MSAQPDVVIDERLLPPTLSRLRRILRAIGPRKTIALLKARGGTRLKLMHGPLLHGLLGEPSTKLLLDAFPDESEILLPKADKLIAQIRNRVIVAEAGAKSLTEQALEHDLTTRQIINIRHAPEPETGPSPQPDLFDGD